MRYYSLRRLLFALVFVLVWWWWLALPRPLFDSPLSLVVEDRNGQLLGARVAADGQWRFPAVDSLPLRVGQCIIAFEDKRFYEHWGVDVWAVARAIRQNFRAGQIVSGASTLSMQVLRMARGNRERSFRQKLLETLLAIRLEMRYDKDEILRLWANHAPFGGNVVGIEAASQRYFGKPPHLLSWAEAATLAVLPNSPGLIHPGRKRAALKQKRNRLLANLLQSGLIDSLGYQLALKEPLPDAPLPLADHCPHLTERLAHTRGPGRWTVTLDGELQARLTELSTRYQRLLAGNGIHNLAMLVVDNRSGQTLAYIGNIPGLAPAYSPHVDLIQAPRSPGSLLKPLLYSLALQQGTILPGSLLPDVPTVIQGFRPENFHQDYAGAVAADQALARSLNIPFVHLLRAYGVGTFHSALKKWGFSYIDQGPEHYGLALILGGCEISLWQAVAWYSSLARSLDGYTRHHSTYGSKDWRAPHYVLADSSQTDAARSHKADQVGAAAAWHTLQSLETLERPTSEGQWQRFASSRRLAWKTGTSYGFRDAWAVGVDTDYTIGVWVGNADGEGRPGLVGVRAAAPLLFAASRLLPASQEWFRIPHEDRRPLSVCRRSGYLAQAYCPAVEQNLPQAGRRAPQCTFHQLIHLST
ncbi:MAG: penicillin-binding protein 1C, partial [Bacteroidetes bacterium]